MRNPQTRAATIGRYGCLAMCYLWCAGIRPESDGEMIRLVSEAMDRGLLDDECTVLDAARFLEYFTGRRFRVEKRSVTGIDGIAGPAPVRFSHNGNGHWVVVEGGRIVFNSIADSVCVSEGRPDSARIITEDGQG